MHSFVSFVENCLIFIWSCNWPKSTVHKSNFQGMHTLRAQHLHKFVEVLDWEGRESLLDSPSMGVIDKINYLVGHHAQHGGWSAKPWYHIRVPAGVWKPSKWHTDSFHTLTLICDLISMNIGMSFSLLFFIHLLLIYFYCVPCSYAIIAGVTINPRWQQWHYWNQLMETLWPVSWLVIDFFRWSIGFR